MTEAPEDAVADEAVEAPVEGDPEGDAATEGEPAAE
jgi:hypothetical protein